MARNIKPYNYSYRIAKRCLTENPKVEFTYVVIYTIKHLPEKHNYSKEGVKRAWNDYQKLRLKNPFFDGITFTSPLWPNRWPKVKQTTRRKDVISYKEWKKLYECDWTNK